MTYIKCVLCNCKWCIQEYKYNMIKYVIVNNKCDVCNKIYIIKWCVL